MQRCSITANRASVVYKPKNQDPPNKLTSQSKSSNEAKACLNINLDESSPRVTRGKSQNNPNAGFELADQSARKNSSQMRALLEDLKKNDEGLQMPFSGVNVPRINSSTQRFLQQVQTNNSVQPRQTNYGLTNFNAQNSFNFGPFADNRLGTLDMRIGQKNSALNNSVVQALQGDAGNSERIPSFFTNGTNSQLDLYQRKSTLRNQHSKDYRTMDTLESLFANVPLQNKSPSQFKQAGAKPNPVVLDINKDILLGEAQTSLDNPIADPISLQANNSIYTEKTNRFSIISQPADARVSQTKPSNLKATRQASIVSRSSRTGAKISDKRTVKKTQKELEKIDRLALPPTKIPKMVLDNEESFDSEESVKNKKKKRGRKMMESDKYVQASENKINEWKNLLKVGKWPDGKVFTEADVAKLKNQISAQRSRANKKMEVQALKNQIHAIHQQVKLVIKAFDDESSLEQKQKIVDNIYKDYPKKHNEILQLDAEASGKVNASQSSKSKKAVGEKFDALLGKFIGF